jgi:signal transduction histidine kinase
MNLKLDSLRSRVVILLLGFALVAHLAGLWLYAEKNSASTALLYDAILAERIALIAQLAERTSEQELPGLLDSLSGPVVKFTKSSEEQTFQTWPEGSRFHLLEHLLSSFLGLETHDDIRTTYTATETGSSVALVSAINASAHKEVDHLPAAQLAEIRTVGRTAVAIKLSDGNWLRAEMPLLGVAPFSGWKLGASVGAMLAMMLPLGFWILSRWTQPLAVLASAAERLGRDIQASALAEEGPQEIRSAVRAFNVMQQRIRRLVEDRIAFAAAIAHDLGTPVTRLHLRAEEIADAEVRHAMLADLGQLRRMITDTLSFARLDFASEPADSLDLTSLVQRVCDDYSDLGADVAVSVPTQAIVTTKSVALHRALSNLVGNAIKYGKRARVTLVETDKWIEILVDDDGPGIADASQAEVFEPFRRLPQDEKVAEGTGLGLTTARSWVRSLGGEISLHNRSEGGLRATVRIPK